MPLQSFDDLAQGNFQVVCLVANHGEAQHGQLSVILPLHFRNGHIELVMKSVLDTLHNLTLVLERASLAKQQTHTQGAYDHSVNAPLWRIPICAGPDLRGTP